MEGIALIYTFKMMEDIYKELYSEPEVATTASKSRENDRGSIIKTGYKKSAMKFDKIFKEICEQSSKPAPSDN